MCSNSLLYGCCLFFCNYSAHILQCYVNEVAQMYAHTPDSSELLSCILLYITKKTHLCLLRQKHYKMKLQEDLCQEPQ